MCVGIIPVSYKLSSATRVFHIVTSHPCWRRINILWSIIACNCATSSKRVSPPNSQRHIFPNSQTDYLPILKETLTSPLNTRLQIRPPLPPHPPQQLLRPPTLPKNRQIHPQIRHLISLPLSNPLSRKQSPQQLNNTLNIPRRINGKNPLPLNVWEC